ncbi:MAG: hypothetical protein U0736_03070 [Gemmataceae bacterium]
MSDPQPWHRLFGLCWSDLCEGTALDVSTETDLSVRQQFVDLLLTRRGPGPLPDPLPDGFDDLAAHNVVTFKSYQEALDGWALCELVSHYVNTRKQRSPSLKQLLPEADFRLYAVCVRYPHNLAGQATLTRLREGVYELPLVTRRIRVIVVQELPQQEQNALLLLFSAREEQVQYGKQHYQPRTSEMTSLVYKLISAYKEDPDMSEALKQFAREVLAEVLADASVEQKLEGRNIRQKIVPPESCLSKEEMRALDGCTETASEKEDDSSPGSK